jgi:hypothetical protein
MTNLRRTLTLAALAALGGAAFASADTAEVRLPDDSVVCGFYRDADTPSRVFCNWEGSDDEGVTLAARGRARIVPSTGTVRDARGPVLRYGKTRRFGRLSCKSWGSEMECWSRTTSHGFRARGGKRPILFATREKDCGDIAKVGAGAYGVRARHASCRTARRVARTYYERRAVPGWRCAERQLDLEAWKARCTRGESVVRFEFGA